jgi:hypothetical protein
MNFDIMKIDLISENNKYMQQQECLHLKFKFLFKNVSKCIDWPSTMWCVPLVLDSSAMYGACLVWGVVQNATDNQCL